MCDHRQEWANGLNMNISKTNTTAIATSARLLCTVCYTNKIMCFQCIWIL